MASKTKAETTTSEPTGTDEDTFVAPETAPKTPEPTEGSVRVKYIGSTVHTRVLSQADFSKAGLNDVGKHTWELENSHTVDLSNVNDAEKVAEFLTTNDLFKVEGKPTFKRLEAGEL